MLVLIFVLYFLAYSNGVKAEGLDPRKLQDPKHIHAVLISASPCNHDCDLNYATEAEIARTYHTLIKRGIPADNIILFLHNSFSNNTEANPYPGTLYADKSMSRNYNEGLKIDYSGSEINEENYLAVLKGEIDKIKRGTGRVLKSTQEDRVFVSHEGHGMDGYLLVNDDSLTVKELHDALNVMNEKKMFKELTYCIMACHSGSMFAGHLNESGNIYAVTAANPNQDAYPKDTIAKDGKETYINSGFGSAWLDDSELHDTRTETMEKQFEDVKVRVKKSEESRYGNLKISQEPVANFEGPTSGSPRLKSRLMVIHRGESRANATRWPISPIARYLRLKKQEEEKGTKNVGRHNKIRLLKQEKPSPLVEMEKEREQIKTIINEMVDSLYGGKKPTAEEYESLRKSPHMISQLDCHDQVTKKSFALCKRFLKSPLVDEFFTPLVNMCERKFKAEDIIKLLKEKCPTD